MISFADVEYRQVSRWSVITGQWGPRRTWKARSQFGLILHSWRCPSLNIKHCPLKRGIGPQTLLAMSWLTSAQRGAIQCWTPADLEPYREYPALDLHLNLFASGLLDKPNFKSNCLHAKCLVHSYPMKTSAGKCHLLSGIAWKGGRGLAPIFGPFFTK